MRKFYRQMLVTLVSLIFAVGLYSYSIQTRRGILVARAGFEPAISTLRG